MGDGINWFLTALFNPLFLLFILGFFFFGKLVGRMVSRPNVWKLLILCYFGIFLIEPLRNLGWVFGGSFLLGFFSGTIRNLPGILAWADGLGDIVFALKHRNAYEELKRQEERFEEELRRAREEAARANAGQSRQQQEWANEAKRARGAHQQAGENEKARGGRRSDRQNEKLNAADPPTAKMRLMREHLQTLGLDPNRTYSLHEIKKAWKKLTIQHHPDAAKENYDPVKYRQIQSARAWLQGASV